MIDGLTSQPFSARTLPPIPHPEVSFVSEIISTSRSQYTKSRSSVEEAVVKFHESGDRKAISPNTNTVDKKEESIKPKSNSKFVEYVVPQELKEKQGMPQNKNAPSKNHNEYVPKPKKDEDTITLNTHRTNNTFEKKLVNPLPLSELEKKPVKIDNVKVANPERLNSLKYAIQKAMADKARENDTTEKVKIENTNKGNQAIKENFDNRSNINKTNDFDSKSEKKEISLDEVPKDVLEKVLRMED
jgi:hypothetical protein